MKNKKVKNIKFIDLFAGLGGTRIGFENACKKLGYKGECVFTSEIKETAINTYKNNFKGEEVFGDITQIDEKTIPNFDFLLAGFPCQPFSSAGNRLGFYDTRGTLFFDVERIIKEKTPTGFLLENVEGLSNHDGGKTLQVIINNLKALGYNVSYKIIDSSEYGVPQKRKRTYIVGRLDKKIDLENFTKSYKKISEVLESNKEILDIDFTRKLLKKFKVEELHGKSIKDKRGGEDNIHSWDFSLKGTVSKIQKDILNFLLKERRKKHWAEKKGIEWMDGMPLTLDEIKSTLPANYQKGINLKKELDDLVKKGYIKFEYPKKQIREKVGKGTITKRVYDTEGKKGYNIVTGKLSFEINKILDPNSIAPTLVATDAIKLGVVDGEGVRRLTIREGLRLFGFPEDYTIEHSHVDAFDLLGNSVVVPVIEMVSLELIK